MKKRALLLFLSADRLHAQIMEDGKITTERDFIDLQEDREKFASFLQTVKCPAYLLTDLIEEDFRHETVPHLFGGNRTALLKRKFDQFYQGTPFHQATLLKRQKTGRRDDDMLFSALTNPSLVTTWVNIMLDQQTPLAGIYSVPQISAPLIKDHPSNYLLLISWEKSAGLRQTYFSSHRLQISRLTPVHANMTFQDAVTNEFTRTYQYLKSLSMLPSGQTLDVRILCHGDDQAELEAKLKRDSSEISYDFADLADIAKQLKIDYTFTDSDATQIFLHQLAASPPKTQYGNSTHTHFFKLWQLRRALMLASGVLLLGASLWSAGTFWQSSVNARETTSIEAQAQKTLNATQEVIATFPNTYAPAADMKAGVVIKHKLDHYAPVLQDILGPISTMLDRNSKIQLDDISWEMNASEPVANGTFPDIPAQVIILKGTLLDFENDYRAALNYLENFQRDLTSQGYVVTALIKPLDVSPSGSIADQREAGGNVLGFSLKLSWRPPS